MPARKTTGKEIRVITFYGTVNIDGDIQDYAKKSLNYKLKHINKYKLNIEDYFLNVFNKFHIEIDGIRKVTIAACHPDVESPFEIAYYDPKHDQLIFNNVEFIVRKWKDKDKKITSKNTKSKNESVLYQCILFSLGENCTQYKMRIDMKIYSHKKFEMILQRFNSSINLSMNDNTNNKNNNNHIKHMLGVDKNKNHKSQLQNSNYNNKKRKRDEINNWLCTECDQVNDDSYVFCEECFVPRPKPKPKLSPSTNKSMIKSTSIVDVSQYINEPPPKKIKLSQMNNNNNNKKEIDLDQNNDEEFYLETNANNSIGNSKMKNQQNNDINVQITNKVLKLSNLESQNVFLVKKTFKIIKTGDLLTLICRKLTLNKQKAMGKGPTAKIIGVGSATTLANYQKCGIAFLNENERRETSKIALISLYVSRESTLLEMIKANLKPNNNETINSINTVKKLAATISDPGDKWPKINQLGITEQLIENQKNLIAKRLKAWIQWKKLKQEIKNLNALNI
eukprot:194023_1